MAENESNGTFYDNGSGGSSHNSVSVHEAAGAVFLGLICAMLLMALLRSQRRERKLLEEMVQLTSQS